MTDATLTAPPAETAPAPRTATYPSLIDKRVLISGGGSGIGAVMVAAFAGQGARVTFLDILDDESRALVDQLGSGTRHEVCFLPCDLRDLEALDAAVGMRQAMVKASDAKFAPTNWANSMSRARPRIRLARVSPPTDPKARVRFICLPPRVPGDQDSPASPLG